MAMTACAAKFCNQIDLLVGERTDFRAVDDDCADQLIVLDHRDGEYGPITGEIDGGDDKGIALDVGVRRLDVGDMGHLLRDGDTARAARSAAAGLVGRACRTAAYAGGAFVQSNRAIGICLAQI